MRVEQLSLAAIIPAVFCLLVCGCADYNENGEDGGGENDADGTTVEDAGSDPGPADQGLPDAGHDAGGSDAGGADAGPHDAGTPDGTEDAGHDAGIIDGGADQDLDGGGADSGPTDCPAYLGALADCPYQLVIPPQAGACMDYMCMNAPCGNDQDCPQAGELDLGEYCVAGNCVFCWHDVQCAGSQVCRAGRCVEIDPFVCESNPTCSADRCSNVSVSEVPCPVCTCDSFFNRPCQEDGECLIISSHPYLHCVYGRCAECRHDDECGWGTCLPPGMCFLMEPHPEVLYGTWLIGWHGGLDHLSYFRFEADGTLRRARYEEGMVFGDDIPPMPCWPQGVVPYPLIGTWEPHVTSSGFLVVTMSLNISCDPGAGWAARYMVILSNDLMTATFQDLDGSMHYQAYRVTDDRCLPDFSLCDPPSYPFP